MPPSTKLPVEGSIGNCPDTNIKKILEQAGLSMNNVVKTCVFLADINDFAEMNEVYATFFEAPFPARSAMAVKTLPKNSRIEIECIAMK